MWNFSTLSAKIIADHPSKFLWPGLLAFFKGKISKVVDDCMIILSRMDILQEPGSQMIKLLDIFA